MTTDDDKSGFVKAFRAWVEAKLAKNDTYHAPQHFDRDDGSTLTARWPMHGSLWLEVTVRPLIPQVRVGIVTEDRWKSEEIEDAIETSGDNMSEYLEVALAEAGLDWSDPPVEHYRDQGRWFSFVTPIELSQIQQLADDQLRTRVLQLIEAYTASYGAI